MEKINFNYSFKFEDSVFGFVERNIKYNYEDNIWH